ncbi:hypothetical protein [Paenibacillus caui]|uniref:hypothetical protein n=1 Tax=Paenibacillus caui TaxID=2873927 RepID=UPI001CA85E29|nr:hypothetical protein [Paenibacillus caui]
MTTGLLQDAINLFHAELSPETGIRAGLDTTDPLLSGALKLLEDYPLPPLRSARILALYFTIVLAMERHHACHEAAPDSLTRQVLDGDYLYSLYLQMALKWKEYDFVSVLAPYIKKIQLKRAEGRPQDDLLLQGIACFMELARRKFDETG